MPVAIACPNCQTVYNLQETFLGKSVKCRKCGSVFQANSPEATATNAPATQPTSDARRSEYAKMGLQGPIANSPGLFDDGSVPPTSDPLANHVIYDPGFAAPTYTSPVEETSATDAGYEDVLHNVALDKPKVKKKKKDPLADYLTEEELDPTKKKKVEDDQPATPTGKAAVSMYWAAGVTMLSVLFRYMMVRGQIEELEVLLTAQELDAFWIGEQVIVATGIGVGFVLLFLGAVVAYIPVAAITLGLVIYGCFTAFEISYSGEVSPRGMAFNVIILLSLAYGLWDAIKIRRRRKNTSSKKKLKL